MGDGRTFERVVLTAYLIAVAFGGTLLGASLLLGGKVDKPALEAGGHSDGHDHVHDHHDVDAADAVAWLPLSSIRFWTFFFAFAGAVGAAITLTGALGSAALVAAIAVAVGYATGVGAVTAVRLAGARSANSATSGRDLQGATGTLLLGAGPSSPGKVRVEVKGRAQDLIAVTDDEALASGATVMVVSVDEAGRALVTRHDDEQAPPA